MKQFLKQLKNKRGFSLVELMVVVAIMGTLATIAIPAYNEYRKSAKKTAYRTDMLSLHKGWLAFGVELDSFCERDTSPQDASIGNVGMASLVSSKLYGAKGLCEASGTCNATNQGTCTGSASSAVCSTNSAAVTLLQSTCSCSWNATAGTGPGKHNFIGFSTTNTNCTDPTTNAQLAANKVHIRGEAGGVQTTVPAGCELNVAAYNMGVYGHVAGNDAFGISVNNNGVVSNEHNATIAVSADSNCT